MCPASGRVCILENALPKALSGLSYTVNHAIHKRTTKIAPPVIAVCGSADVNVVAAVWACGRRGEYVGRYTRPIIHEDLLIVAAVATSGNQYSIVVSDDLGRLIVDPLIMGAAACSTESQTKLSHKISPKNEPARRG